MARHSGEGSIYQRSSDDRWVGVVDLGWVGGKRVRRTVTANTLKQLRPKFKALQAKVESGTDPNNTTVESWMNSWLNRTVDGKLRPSTAATYRRYVNKWIIPYLGKRRLDKLRPEHIEAMYDAMEEAGRTDATRRQVHAILHRGLKMAVRRNLLQFNPAERVEPPPVGQGSHGKFELTEAKTILRSLADDPMRSRWVCALLAGLRQGEALGLQWSDVDFDRNVIVIQRALQQVPGEGLQLVRPKSAASYRAVPMVMPVREVLLADAKPDGFVWGGEKPTAPRADWGEWTAMLNRAGVEHRPLHAARATTGSLLMDAGVSEKIISEILGHSQVQTTQKHYLHGDDTMHRAAMDALERLLED